MLIKTVAEPISFAAPMSGSCSVFILSASASIAEFINFAISNMNKLASIISDCVKLDDSR